MNQFEMETEIDAPIQRCFDLARDIDLHRRSMARSKEVAVAGVTTGLIGANEFVSWEARHLGLRWRVTSRITLFDPPHRFADEMDSGPFRVFRHEHRFKEVGNGTVMLDVVDYALPFGVLGGLADAVLVRRYLLRLFSIRNDYLKREAESPR